MAKASPTLVTQASGPVAVGGNLSDTATLAGGVSPTGTITFNLYPPSDATCIATPAFTSTKPVTGNADYTSDPFTATSPGTWRWVASYSGDANNDAKSGACGDANEATEVAKASPTLTTQASAPVSVGGNLSDTATLAAGASPTGTITFNLYGPTDATCTATPAFTSTKPVTGNADYTSDPFTATAPGTWRWVASYSGDANNDATSGACGDANESTDVAKASPTLVTQASGPVAVGGNLSDTATLAGGVSPTGTITFNLFPPSDATCAATPAFTSTKPVTGTADYSSHPFTATAPGTWRWVASYSGDANNDASSGTCGDANESTDVAKASPTLVTQASAPVSVGGNLSDTATLAGGASPTGTITFNLYGPTDATCTATPAFTSTKPVTGNADYSSDPFTATAPGTWRWVASYSGDANNDAKSGACGDANESTDVAKASPTLVTQASAPVAVGGNLSDTATLAGGASPTGTITFNLYGPTDATCTATPAFTSTKPVTGNADYSSDPFTATAPGTWRWVASYSGDANNDARSGACGDANESTDVAKASPTLVTQASGPVAVGGNLSDTATLAGGVSPTGTITFNLYPPSDATCIATPAFTSTKPVTGNADYTSDPFTATSPGTWRWVASYSGDANNDAKSGACGDANEATEVAKASPTLTTQASAPVSVGGNLSDTATLAAGASPTGTITFNLYGPTDATCTATPAFTSTKPVTGNADYTSDPFTATAPGTWRWVASYSGDANNDATSGACGDANESTDVAKASPTLVTQASGPVAVGGNLSDTATLAGGVSPTGTITFNLFPPSDATCAATPAFTSTKPVTGTADYSSHPFTATAPGTWRWVASYSGDANNDASSGTCGDANESTDVAKASPTLVTQASAPVSVGGNLSDTATLAGGASPTGTITFNLYGPTDATCTATPAFTSTKPVTGNADYSSDPFTATAPGTWRWVASYSGDANNDAKSGACGDANESTDVAKASPTLVTQASAPVAVGGNLSDTATLAGGASPTGTITFNLYGPTDATCTATPAFTSTKPVTGNADYSSDPFTATAPGTWRWVASYSGDANNDARSGACGDANESTDVAKASPTLVTQASGPVAVGGNLSDTATLAGGVSPTGTITFNLYPPSDATCTATPAFTSTKPVTGNADYTSDPFTATAPGTWRWVASYSGDANNDAMSGACGDTNESADVAKASPTLTTQASAPVAVGGNLSDTATLAGGASPTATITFSLFGPTDATCAATPAFTSTKSVTGNADYTSDPFTATSPGTWRWVASYSGDANNDAKSGACGDTDESTEVAKASPTLTTQASAPVAVGGNLVDTATLAGGVSPTGTVTFSLFGPADATCGATPAFTSTKPVTGNADYSSDPFTATAPGTWRWVASYSGDANNDPRTGACGDANESTEVAKASPTLTTQASAPVAVGGNLSDTATIASGASPTGTITFNLYGPTDATCTATPAFTSTKPVTGNADYSSDPFTATAPGTWRWVASYSGDANNDARSGACGDANESTEVAKASPTLTTQASAPVSVGGNLSDTATLAAGASPTGTITFNLYGPTDATCTATPAFTSTKPVTGNADYSSDPFTATAPGTWRWVASYSGDANNDARSGACGDANESTEVAKASPTLTTQASAPVSVGGNLSDTATLAGGASPTGTITFNLYPPSDSDCLATPAFTSTKPIIGNADYASDPFAATSPGTWRWVSSYSGDANNDARSGACGDANEATEVAKASPTLTTQASAPVSVGGNLSDTATLAGGASPTGTITFDLYGPTDASCTATPAFTSTKPVTGNADYTSDPFTATAPGTWRWVASYSGDANNDARSGACGDANESTDVAKASPTLTTHASAPVTVGGNLSDTATLAGGANPTGTITFSLYGPADATCTGTPAFTSTKPVTGNADYTSDPFTATAPGTWRWVASYSGDANNDPRTGACGDTNESTDVTKASPTLVTQASTPVPVGGHLSDTATLAGAASPTGTITFNLFPPADATCTASPAFTSTKSVTGNGDYTSDPFTATAPGTWRWIAAYSGDPNNDPKTGACDDANESTNVIKATPTLVTQASGSVPVGGTLSDTATLAGGANPMGTITFNLYPPSDATCAATPAFTSTKAVTGNADYPSDSFTATGPGTWRWVASYSGDANNDASTGSCGDANESTDVAKASPTLTTQASAPVAVGGNLSDTATIAGGASPTGTITFNLFGPTDATCTATPAFTSTKPVTGNADYPSDPFTATAPGTWRWVASYSGDADNDATSGACGDANESTDVAKASPTLTTQASAPVAVGGNLSDTATIAGSASPTGTITFSLFGPTDATCADTPTFTSTKPVTGNADYPSDPFAATAPGTWRWVASYSGDANNDARSGACGDANESTDVAKATPTLATQASAPVPVGGSLSDSATLAGGASPTGTITFDLYGPTDASCTATPAFTSTKPVTGSAEYTSDPFTATAPGTWRWVASYSGDANNDSRSGACGDANESTDVAKASPTLTTHASAPVTVGGNLSDTAALAGGANPTGTITFSLYGPADATCTAALAYASTKPVTGNADYSSDPYTATGPGTWRWVASYSGDANNDAKSGACGDASESTEVAKASPTLVTQASGPVAVGGNLSDTATLAGGISPAGTITFNLYPPSDPTCAATPAFTSIKSVTGNGDYTSDPFTATAPGTWRWIASYSGDGNNDSKSGACGDADESTDVAGATPTLTTQASSPVPVGGSISATATLTGGANPTGTITFNAYGPADANCTATPAYTSATMVTGNGDYASGDFTAPDAGTYHWIASYSGDASNDPRAGACGGPGASVIVRKAVPTLATRAFRTPPGAAPSFAPATSVGVGVGSSPSAVTSADLDADGRVDLVVANSGTGNVSVLVNSASGLQPAANFNAGSLPSALAVGDLNGDGKEDLAVANSGSANVSVLLGDGAGVFGPPVHHGVGAQPTSVAIADLNNDAKADLAVANGASADVSVLLGDGNGSFAAATIFAAGTGPSSVAVADVNGDGRADLVVTNHGSANVSLLAGDGAGSFAPPVNIGVGSGPTSIAIGDLNADGNPDLVVANGASATVSLLLGDGAGNFAPAVDLAVSPEAHSVVLGDFNLDGRTDIATADTGSGGISVLVANGAGAFASGFTLATGSAPSSVTAADLNSDGRPDLASANKGSGDVAVLLVGPATPTPGPAVVGDAVADVATLTGTAPTGDITFRLFGPDNATCAGPPIFQASTPVTETGEYFSSAFVTSAAGAYRFVAAYSGDANNEAVVGACDDPDESVVVETPPTPTTTTPTTTVPPSTTVPSTTVPTTTPPPPLSHQPRARPRPSRPRLPRRRSRRLSRRRSLRQNRRRLRRRQLPVPT